MAVAQESFTKFGERWRWSEIKKPLRERKQRFVCGRVDHLAVVSQQLSIA